MESRTENELAFIADPWPPAAGRPTLVFIHGAAMSKGFWLPQIESLSEKFNTVAPDLPGHGESPDAGFGEITRYTDRLVEWLDALSLPRPIPCGLSLGGAVCLDLLLRYAKRFEAGILINTGARLRVLPLIFETIENNFDDFIEMLKVAAVSPANQNPAMGDWIKDLIRCRPETALNDFRACDGFDVMDRAADIKAPVLVVSGNDDTTTPPKYAAWLADNIPGARLDRIEKAAHLAPLEQPGPVSAAITDFLRNLPE